MRDRTAFKLNQATQHWFNTETLGSNVRGIYLAGVVTAGKETGKIFIENGRLHGDQIIYALLVALAAEER